MTRRVLAVLICLTCLCGRAYGDDKPLILRGHKESVGDIAFSPDGSVIGSVGFDNQAILWNIETGKLLHRVPGRSQIAFLDCGKSFVTCDGSRLQVRDSASGELIHEERRHFGSLRAPLEGDWFAIAEVHPKFVIGRSSKSKRVRFHFRLPSMYGGSITDVSRDGRLIAFRAHGQFGWLNVGNPSFRLVPSGSSRIRRGAILNAVFSPDASQRLICQQNQISRYDCAKLRTAVLIECDEWRQRFAAPVGEILGFRDAVFVADTGLVALAVRFKESEAPKGGRIDVLESNTKNIRRSIPLERLPTNIACSVDGTVLAAGCSDGTVRVWRLDLKRDEQSGLEGAWSAAERTRHLHDGWCVPRTLQELRIENSASVLAALRGAVD